MKIFATAHFWRTSPRRKNNLLHGHIQWAYFDNKKQNFLFATWCCNATLLTRKGIFLKMKIFATAHFWRTSPRCKNNLLHHHIQWAYFDKRKQNFQDVGTKTFFCNRKIGANWIFFPQKRMSYNVRKQHPAQGRPQIKPDTTKWQSRIDICQKRREFCSKKSCQLKGIYLKVTFRHIS